VSTFILHSLIIQQIRPACAEPGRGL